MGDLHKAHDDVLTRILVLKNNKSLSDAELEKHIGLKAKTIDSWKRGNSKSYLKIIPQLAELFEVSTDFLLGIEKKAAPQEQLLDEERQNLLNIIRNMNDDEITDILNYIEIVKLRRKR